MKVYEYGERCEEQGLLWSNLVIESEQSFSMIQASLIAKFELNISLIAEALDEYWPDDCGVSEAGREHYVNANLADKDNYLHQLSQARAATSLSDLCAIGDVFITKRGVAEYVGGDYWSLLADKAVNDMADVMMQ